MISINSTPFGTRMPSAGMKGLKGQHVNPGNDQSITWIGMLDLP